MGNFDFLLENPEYESFSKLAIEAEKQLNKNTMFCGIAARKCVEQAVLWMYSVDSDLDLPYNENIQSLVHQDSFVRIVPNSILRDIQISIKVGNVAVHENTAVEKKKALLSITSLFNFLSWIDYTYNPANYKQRKFDQNLIPSHKVVIKIKSPKDEVSKFRDELEEKERTIQELKKQLASKLSLIEERKKLPVKVDFTPENISEADTRKLFIDSDLEANGWQFDDVMVKREFPLKNIGNKGSNGFADYVLFGKDGLPLAVVEAKKTSKDPNIGKQQAKDYADALENQFGRRPFIFYTNGFDCVFWDDTQASPRDVSMIFGQRDLQKLMDRRNQKKNLDDIQIKKEITERYYQIEAIKSVVQSVNAGRRRFLLVMATGTGKTRTAVSLVDVLYRANYVINVLFLADRTELVKQAHDAFKEFLPSMTLCNLLDQKERENNKNARVVFSTYQTVMNAVDTEKDEDNNALFTPAHFDLIIVDEAHRSIFKKYKAIFEYFDAYAVGLTATPRDEMDRNTFEFFTRGSQDPDYYYSYAQAITDKNLVPYKVISNSTTFIEEGITYDNLSEEDKRKIQEEYHEEGEENFEEIPPESINKYVFNTDTIKKVLTELIENGIKTEGGDAIGKTIIFAYNKKHAQAIVDEYNQLYPLENGETIARIVCDDSKVSETIANFKKDDSKLKIAVSIDMLDTGVDIPEVVNLVFFKKIKSKIKFDQMIGRGTRLCPNLICTDNIDGTYISKKYFYIFDWLKNFEFFNQHPEETEGRQPKSLNEVLFARRCHLIFDLQKEEFSDEKSHAFRNSLIDAVVPQIASLDLAKTEIKLRRKIITRFQTKEAFQFLNESDIKNLEEDIAPLVQSSDNDFYAKGFDSAVYNFMINKIEGKSTERHKNYLSRVAEKLCKKHSIEAVYAKMPEIHKLIDGRTYESRPLTELEELRAALRELVSFTVDSKDEKYQTVTYIDSIIRGTVSDVNVEVPITYEEYQKRVNSYIQEHLNIEPIMKLRNNVKLSKDDYNTLEEVFTCELGNKDYFDRMREEKPLGVFVRSIAKKNIEKINELFAEYMNEENWNFKQIQFVKKIIDIVVEQGQINIDRLFNGYAPYNRPGTLISLFGESSRKKILHLITTINENGTKVA